MLRTVLQRSGTALLFGGGGRAIAGEVRERIEKFIFSRSLFLHLRAFACHHSHSHGPDSNVVCTMGDSKRGIEVLKAANEQGEQLD